MNIPDEHMIVIGGPEVDLTFKEKIADVGHTLGESWNEEGVTGKAVLTGAAITQFYERSLIPEVIAPPIAIEVFQRTNGSTLSTGLVLGGLVMAQQLVIGGVWAETLNRFEKVSQKITEHFPKTKELAEDIGPAKERNLFSNVREGFSGFLSYGTTPFLIAQKTYEPELSRKEGHKTAARISLSIGLAGVAIGKAITEVIQELPAEYQDDVVRVIEKPYTWIGLAALYEVPRFVKKRMERRHAQA